VRISRADHDWQEPDDGPSQREGLWKSKILGLGLLAVAIIAFELSANASLAVVVGCLKFAEKDVRTALWLRATDPDRRRGRTCSWYYITFGIYKVGWMALIVLFVFFFAASFLGAAQPVGGPLVHQGITAVLTIFACYVLGGLTACLGVGSALRHGIKVWVNPCAHRARMNGQWPIEASELGALGNVAGFVVLLAAAATSGATLAASITLTVWLFRADINALLINANHPAAMSFGLVLACDFALAAVLFPLLAGFLTGRTTAAGPWQCYAPSPPLPGEVADLA
jgi:hypothetical protein